LPWLVTYVCPLNFQNMWNVWLVSTWTGLYTTNNFRSFQKILSWLESKDMGPNQQLLRIEHLCLELGCPSTESCHHWVANEFLC
jgi:hypothetical protein